jgi:osmotically inducible protein OsmC
MATRNGSAAWRGYLKTGSGQVMVGDAGWTSAYSYTSRFHGLQEDAGSGDTEPGPATNPEELLAAAHAACFSMAFSLVLTQREHPPSTIETQAHVYLRNVSGIPTIQRIDLDTEADVPGIDEAELRQWAEEARTGCIISRALSGVEEITLSARLR